MYCIIIDTAKQLLSLFESGKLQKTYPISTALNGLGEKKGSGCTPIGKHYIRVKIGANCSSGAVFVGRRFTGETYSQQLADRYPDRDWILTRIMWLCGREPGKNRLADVDTMQRYIYIHGTPDTEPMGVPLSHGCIRMRNHDVIDLFNSVPVGTDVNIF